MSIKVDGLPSRPYDPEKPRRNWFTAILAFGFVMPLSFLAQRSPMTPLEIVSVVHLGLLFGALLMVELPLEGSSDPVDRAELLTFGAPEKWLLGCSAGYWASWVLKAEQPRLCLALGLLVMVASRLLFQPRKLFAALLGGSLAAAAAWFGLGQAWLGLAAFPLGFFLGTWADTEGRARRGEPFRVLMVLLPWSGYLAVTLGAWLLAAYLLMLSLALALWVVALAMRLVRPALARRLDPLTAPERARRLLQAARFAEARACLEPLLGKPVDARTTQLMAYACGLSEDWQGAKEIYEGWLERDPQNGIALAGLAETWWWLGQPERAKEVALRAGEEPAALAVRATVAYERDPAQALELADRALAGDPNSGHALEARAYALRILERREEARAAFQKLIAALEEGKMLENRLPQRATQARKALADL